MARYFSLVVMLLVGGGFAQANEVSPGETAPDFTLQGSDGKSYTLSNYRGTSVVLAWFPKAFTGG